MSEEKDDKNGQDYLKDFLKNSEFNDGVSEDDAFDSVMPTTTTTGSKIDYIQFDTKQFPLGQFYPTGTTIMIRPASVKEVQAYSTVDNDNFADIVAKMNDMLSSCVRVKHPDGSMRSYLDLMDGDRFYAIFLVRELTFQRGASLATETTCDCGKEFKIELNTKNFTFYEMDEKIKPFWNEGEKAFVFETINKRVHKIAPPKIGIQKSFTDYIMDEVAKNRDKKNAKLDMSFIKVVPFTLCGRIKISAEGIEKHLAEYKQMDMEDFQFINAAVNKMKFGIKELKAECVGCGQEVHTPMTFPGGASALFVVPDRFDELIKK